ncbi:amphi-Trp domain-containing protein [Nocardioides bruguierae]|uniref:Amphi-Trp domain-containing protein n=1 Tax=Nocardioides bruguierae TaxID=2945102 RepID=A0A9X2IH10_9ACTN|nr:amphi-Trp domain-containing protein [Nocardioides bruguierae]MCL8025239.1 amphi-Trp domain-containing protein [Nocardioides bruguierae]MCM0621310.1 amphi-Trp domain-containing protein [Nocardioides bruguierae]
MADDLFELEQTQRMTREEAAARLRELADSLERHNSVRVTRAGVTVTVAVPDVVDVCFEVEAGDGGEIEVEISW